MLKDPQCSVGTTMCWRPTVAFAFAGEFDSDVAEAAASSVFVSSLSDIFQFRSTKMKGSCKRTYYCVLWSQVKAPQFSLFFLMTVRPFVRSTGCGVWQQILQKSQKSFSKLRSNVSERTSCLSKLNLFYPFEITERRWLNQRLVETMRRRWNKDWTDTA